MEVFATKFLEQITPDHIPDVENWIWTPSNRAITSIYASGAKTSTRASTYASEKDSNLDTDRPNEGH